jgi:hypothetical protein
MIVLAGADDAARTARNRTNGLQPATSLDTVEEEKTPYVPQQQQP